MPLLETPPAAAPTTVEASAIGALHLRYRFLREFIRLAGPYWNSAHKWQVRGTTLALFLLTVAQVCLAVWTNYWNRALFDALEQRSLSGFLLQIGTFFAIFTLTIAVTAVHLQAKRWLQIDWRQWLSDEVLGQWMARGRHYQLQFTPGEHDNPDGRIAEDIRIATEVAIGLAHTLVYSVLILGTFIDILLSVSGAASVPGTSVSVPGHMVVLAFVYAGVGTVLGLLFGRPLVKATNRLQTLEANFRFGLARSRENSEAIALMQGESVERKRSSRQLADLEQGWNRQTLAYMGIVAFSSGYGTLLPVFPILIAAPQYIAGAMTLGMLMQSAQAFQKLTSALSWLIDNLGDMARWRASAERVLSLHADLQALEAEAARNHGRHIQRHESNRAKLVLRDLCIAEADGRILVDAVNAEIRRGETVLITGDSAAAIALFKAVAGQWFWGRGEVLLPRGQPVYFMPQRPFLPDGTLSAVLSYPAPAEAFDPSTMRRALECAGLLWLAPRLADTDQWERVLPPRAQQRIGFARLFLHQPKWIFTEEATNAFDPQGAQHMMDMLRCQLPNATVLMIGFHPVLERVNTRKIELQRASGENYLFDRPQQRQADDGQIKP